MIDEALVELLDDKARDFEKLMARCEPRRCSIYEHRGLMFSETMEVADMVMTGRHRRVPVVRGHLGGALYRSRTIFGAETIEVRDADASALAASSVSANIPPKPRRANSRRCYRSISGSC